QNNASLREEIAQNNASLRVEVARIKTELDRKFTILFVILFFAIVFLNQNALEFLARVLGLIK
ncbi:MAG: hypothetical protein ACE5LU_26580, partial [Anaerolineae bacterium]